MKSNRRTEKFVMVCYRALLCVMFFCCVLIMTGTISTAYNNVFEELLSSSLRIVLPILLASMICIFLILFYRWLDGLRKSQLIVCSVILFFIMAGAFTVVLTNFSTVPNTDAMKVQDFSEYLAATGETKVISGMPWSSYYQYVSNNYFITILYVWFFRFLKIAGIDSVNRSLQIMAVLGIMLSSLFMYMIGIRIGGICKAVKILTLCVMNPLYYLLVLWTYTNVYSIPFTIAVVYFGICVYQEERSFYRLVYCSFSVLCAVVGLSIRGTAAFPLIALVISAFLWMLKKKKRNVVFLQYLFVGILVGGIAYAGISGLENSYFSELSGSNYPATHYLMLGSHKEGKVNSADVALSKSYDTTEEIREVTLQKIIENYKSFGLTEYIDFLYRKLVTSWCYGDGGDLLKKIGQDTKQTKLYSWILGDRSDVYQLYAYAFRSANIFLMLIALADMLGKRDRNPYQFLFLLTFFGGILFHCFWEVKATYQMPFVYFMLLIGTDGGNILAKNLGGIRLSAPKRKSSLPIYSFLACILVFCISSYHTMVYTRVTLHDWSVCNISTKTSNRVSPEEGVSTITQEFYTSKSFNRIVILAEVDEEAEDSAGSYLLSLLGEDGQTIFETVLYAADIPSNGEIVVDTGEICPDGREKYTIRLENLQESSETMYFLKFNNTTMDIYEGALTVNDEEWNYDLYLRVYREYQSMWCSKKVGLLINGGIFAGAVLLCLWMQLSLDGRKMKPGQGISHAKHGMPTPRNRRLGA
ncbi:MAG: hypothetical protein LUG99_14520 [Lachnospiraceae bacterium]|nr:hypothetical protein [Lachnospiraceae bacterium]